MNKLLIPGLITIIALSFSCNRDPDMERQEEFSRRDISEDSYDQSDINQADGPVNLDGTVTE